jgi:hypothetical protein
MEIEDERPAATHIHPSTCRISTPEAASSANGIVSGETMGGSNQANRSSSRWVARRILDQATATTMA